MRTRIGWGVALVALCACGIIVADKGYPQADAAKPCAPKHTATDHRTASVYCATTRPPATPDAASYMKGDCKSDSECVTGSNGRCMSMGRPLDAGTYCTYDSCFADTDCPANTACACNPLGNACVPAQCRTDSDCCPGASCSPSYDLCGGGVTGYYCHTASDTCVNDGDCFDSGLDQCVFQPQSSSWGCASVCLPG